MLTHLHLKLGSSPERPHLSFPLKPSITIFVGPNNSGKSLLLSEIAAECFNGVRGSHTKILNHIEFQAVDRVTAEGDYQKIKREPRPDEPIPFGHSAVRLGVNDTIVFDDTYYRGNRTKTLTSLPIIVWRSQRLSSTVQSVLNSSTRSIGVILKIQSCPWRRFTQTTVSVRSGAGLSTKLSVCILA